MTVDATAGFSAGELLEPADRERYAQAIVHTCVGLSEGDLLIVHAEPAHRELAVALVETAYRAGARYCEVWYRDPLVRRARIANAERDALGPFSPWDARRLRATIGPDAALVSITGEEHPDVFGDLPADRVAEDFQGPMRGARWHTRAQTEERVRFCVVAWPTPAWAASVYPDLPAGEAIAALARDLLWFCRLGPDDGDGTASWARHMETLEARAVALTALDLRRLELRGPGTSLDLDLAPGTRFLSAADENAYGQRPCVNFPTEEVFTSPHAAGTEGTFRCSRPLSLRGRTIEGIAGTFHRGRLTSLEAASEDDRAFLAAYIDTDRMGRRLGEVALVDRASRIGRSGRVYRDSLIDENAASHIAFGSGFRKARSDRNGRADGVNVSSVHLDVMIGSDELEVTAVGSSGRRVPLIAGGDWQPLDG